MKGPTKQGAKTPMKPAAKLDQVKKGAPTHGSGSDTSPYSSARGTKSGGRK